MDTYQNPPSGGAEQETKRLNEATKGNKRLFSEAYDEPEHSQLGSNGENHSQSAPNTAEKRHRASRWPFHNKDHADSKAEKRRGRKSGGSGAGKRTPQRNGRSSRFLEGSMNNRASKKPPQEYFAGYESHSQSEKDESAYASRHSRQPSQAAIMLKDEQEMETEPNRQSGIFKFGSKLAATFNPSKWKIWQKEKPAEENSAAGRLKADAEFKRAYEEVKKRGFIQGNRPGAMALAEKSEKHLNIDQGSDTVMEDTSVVNALNADTMNEENQDSRTRGQNNLTTDNPDGNHPLQPISQSELENKYQRPFPRGPVRLPAVTPEDSISNYSSSSTSPRRGPSQLLEGAFNDDPSRPTRGRIIDSQPPSEGRRPALPRKEMEKQLNLVKKVSTLEFKLRAAQEELALSMGTRLLPRKTRIGIDYEAINAIQLQKQQEVGAQHIATTASAFIQRPPARDEHSINGEDTNQRSVYASASKYSSKRPSVDENISRSPLASADGTEEDSRLLNTTDSMPTTKLPAGISESHSVPTSRLDAGQEHNTEEAASDQEMRKGNIQQRVRSSPKSKKRVDKDRTYRPSRDSDEESGEDADSMTTRTASVKRVKSGPKKRNVEVVDLPSGVSKIRSMRGRVETEESRGRPLKRSGEGTDISTPLERAVVNSRTPSEASIRSTRSSRIPRPRSRGGTPGRELHEKVPPVPAVPVEKLEQASMIPRRSGSTKSLKAATNKHAMVHTGQVLKTPPRRDSRGNKESTPTPKHGRRKSAAGAHGNADGSHEMGKSSLYENSRGLTKSTSTKSGLHNREREMSPSKDAAFDWGPDVF